MGDCPALVVVSLNMRHTLTEIDTIERTATCTVCGPGVRIWKGGARRNGRWVSGRWRCSGRVRSQPSRGRYLDRDREREKKWENNGIVGMTVARFNEMLATQEGKCALCSNEMKKACVDHNHQTGEVRGLLCSTCNTGLGKFGDDPQRLRAAIDYLSTAVGT